jgi:hypothetical protein
VKPIFGAQFELLQQPRAVMFGRSEEGTSLQSVQLLVEGAVLFGKSCRIVDET